MFETNYWEDSITWNGVIFPATLDTLKPFVFKSAAVRPAKEYLASMKETGEIGFDLHYLAKRSKQKVAENLKSIDRLRKIDVPWIKYIIVFSILMTGSIVACFFALSMLRIAQSTLIPICVFFIIGLALAFVFITFLAI